MAKSKADKTSLKNKTRHVNADDEDVAIDDADEPKIKSKTSTKKSTKYAAEDLDDVAVADEPKGKPKTSMKQKTKYAAADDAEFAEDDTDEPPVKSRTSMKKTTKHVDDDELQVKADDDAEEAALDDDEPGVKSKTGTQKKTRHVVDDEAAALEDDDADTQANPDDDEDSIDAGPKPPRAKLTTTTIVLILLNWILAPTFLILAYMDNVVRTQYAYRAQLNYIQALGLPLRSEEDFASLSNNTRTRLRMTPDQLAEVVKARTKKTYKDFQPVEETLDNPIAFRLRPSDMQNAHLKRDVFQDVPDPVATQEEAIEKLQESLPAAIKKAADEVVEKQKNAKDDDEKRAVIAKILLPIAWDVWQVEKLDKKLSSTKGKDLNEMLKDAAQRRMVYDILAPLNIYKPGDLSDFKNYTIEKLSSLDDYDMNQVKKFLTDRLSAAIADTYDPKVHLGKDYEGVKRDSVEKRHTIAFILFTISQISVPTLDRKLIPTGVQRAQVISGLHEFTDASIHYVRSVRDLEVRMVAAVIADRQGQVATVKDKLDKLKDKLTTTPGFIAGYDEEIDRLVKLVEQVEIAEKRLGNAKIVHADQLKTYVKKVDQYRKALDELLEARKTTAKYAAELRVFQDQLHRALVELSNAAEVNFQLHDRIRDFELKKGGKK